MIVTVASFKGGVGKTTTAIHLAAYLNTLAPTLLLDGDPTRMALNYNERGEGLGFEVAPAAAAAKLAGKYTDGKGHVVIDTGQKPSARDLREAIDSSDVMVIPTVPVPMETDGTVQTIQALQEMGAGDRFRVLIVKAPPAPQPDAFHLRLQLEEAGIPLFKTQIPLLKCFSSASGDGRIVSATKYNQAKRAWEAYADAGRELTA